MSEFAPHPTLFEMEAPPMAERTKEELIAEREELLEVMNEAERRIHELNGLIENAETN